MKQIITAAIICIISLNASAQKDSSNPFISKAKEQFSFAQVNGKELLRVTPAKDTVIITDTATVKVIQINGRNYAVASFKQDPVFLPGDIWMLLLQLLGNATNTGLSANQIIELSRAILQQLPQKTQ